MEITLARHARQFLEALGTHLHSRSISKMSPLEIGVFAYGRGRVIMAAKEGAFSFENRSFAADSAHFHTSLIKARITTNVSRIKSYSGAIRYNSRLH